MKISNYKLKIKDCRLISAFIIFNSQFLILNCFAQSTLTLTVNKYEPNCALAAAKINVAGGVPPYYFQWSNGALGDTVSSLNGGSYTVHVSDSDILTPDKDITFAISAYNCSVSINNRFTPNGDGINDTWGISRTEQYPKFLVQVFDRWGQLVHQQRQQYFPWDGTHLGLKLAEATYYFVFFYEEGTLSNYEKGSVTIIR